MFKGLITFLFTSFIWIFSYLILIPISFLVVPIMIKSGWQGYTTLFGNREYGLKGNKAMPATTFWQSCWFLCIRNPLSNLGKETFSVSTKWKWPWHYDVSFTIGWKWGWKENKDPEKNPDRTFVYRPYIRINK